MKRYYTILYLLICVLFFSRGNYVYAFESSKVNGNIKILVDPGHGGIDGGALSKNGTLEKDINLAISLKLREVLIKEGYCVAMTRDEDVGLYDKGKTVREKKIQDLSKRVKLKEESNCNLFISIHQNMFPQSKYYGSQVWHSDDEESKKLAYSIQQALKQNIDPNNKRVPKAAGDDYRILRENSNVPSVIVECGFLSNPNEEELLKSESYQQKLAEAITKGINEYYKDKNAGEM